MFFDPFGINLLSIDFHERNAFRVNDDCYLLVGYSSPNCLNLCLKVVTVGGPLFKRRHSRNIFDEDMNLEITCKELTNFTCDNLE